MGKHLHTVVCQACTRKFQAGSTNAKWCSENCRTRYKRNMSKPAASVVVDSAAPPPAESALMAKTRAELTRAGRLDTFSGQLAMVLAQEMATNPSPALSKELRVVMAAAMEGEMPPAGEDLGTEETPPESDEDILERVRRERALARQAPSVA